MQAFYSGIRYISLIGASISLHYYGGIENVQLPCQSPSWSAMVSSAKDIQFKDLKDTVSQLNTTIRTQNDLILSLQKMLEERNAKDEEKDRIISNLQAKLEYFKQKLFGSSSERRSDIPSSWIFSPSLILEKNQFRNSLNRSLSNWKPANEGVSTKRTMTF